MENKIIVEKGTFEYNDKEYSSYFIAGKIKGKDVKVALMPLIAVGTLIEPLTPLKS